ncbi:MAG TPA: lysophospholipid acyltransferase family protein [Thermomicrobiales bacterium]|nr:lysophospholipid acyltransferase family protein [Thermomicrobiales bacterium]
MLTWALCQIVIRLVRLRVIGREHLPPTGNGPVVVACNHIGWIDPLVIIAALGPQRPVVFLAAREHVEKRRLLDWLLGRLGIVIKVERTSLRQREVLRAAEAKLRGGASIALFPEGRINVTAETGQTLLPFEPGASVIARRGGVPILPMAIAGSDDLYLGRRVTIAIGPPITPGPSHRTDDDTMAEIRQAILATLPPTPPHSRLRIGTWLGRLT